MVCWSQRNESLTSWKSLEANLSWYRMVNIWSWREIWGTIDKCKEKWQFSRSPGAILWCGRWLTFTLNVFNLTVTCGRMNCCQSLITFMLQHCFLSSLLVLCITAQAHRSQYGQYVRPELYHFFRIIMLLYLYYKTYKVQLTWFRSRQTHSMPPSLLTTTRDSHSGS